jgi:hypothetical protein
MSSILEALKRMEGEESPESVVRFPEDGRPEKKGGRVFSLLAVFVAGLGVAAAGFYLVPRPVPPLLLAQQAPEDTSVFLVEAPQVPSVVRPEGTKPLAKPTPPVVTAPKTIPGPPPEKVIRLEFPAERNDDVASPPKSMPSTYVAPEVPKVPKVPEVPEVPEVAPPVDTSEKPVEEAQKLPAADASTYQLQGVRWSETPSRRIAVINSQILREGGVLDGARILAIDPDGVRLWADGEATFLGFSGR